MEELLAYALLLAAGFDVEEKYQTKLDELFLENPTDDFLLELETISSNIKDSICRINIRLNTTFNRDNSCNINYDVFGKALMNSLRPFYHNTELMLFAKRGYSLWQILPDVVWEKEPFFSLNYADEPLCYGDEAHTRQLYEAMLNYYDNE